MTLSEIAQLLKVPYPTVYQWVRTGLVQALREAPEKSQLNARKYNHVVFDIPTAAEIIAVVRLRRIGVSTQRIRAATTKLRAEDITGARWLALCSDGEDVLVRDVAALTRIIDNQGVLNVLDLHEVRSEAQALVGRTNQEESSLAV